MRASAGERRGQVPAFGSLDTRMAKPAGAGRRRVLPGKLADKREVLIDEPLPAQILAQLVAVGFEAGLSFGGAADQSESLHLPAAARKRPPGPQPCEKTWGGMPALAAPTRLR